MATNRHSSIWDRWVGDEVIGNGEQVGSIFALWLEANWTGILDRDANGSMIELNSNRYSWQICPQTLAEIAWLYLRSEITAVQVQEYFSFSDHELLQMADIRDFIESTPAVDAQIARWHDLQAWMNAIEQRGVTNKGFIYTKFGIRNDVASG